MKYIWFAAAMAFTAGLLIRPGEADAQASHRGWHLFQDAKKLYRDKKYDEAIEKIDEILEKYVRESFQSSEWSLHAVRGNCNYMKGNYEEAVMDYEQALSLSPDEFEPFHCDMASFCGQSYIRLGEMTNAFDVYNRAVKKCPDNMQVLTRFAWFLGGTEDKRLLDRERAVTLAKKACDLTDWKEPSTVFALGHVYYVSGDGTNSLKTFNQAMNTGNPDPTGMMQNEFAWFLCTFKDESVHNPTQAIALATDACEATDWKNSGFVDTLAVAYADAGNFSNAVKYLEQAISICTNRCDELIERRPLFKEGKAFRE